MKKNIVHYWEINLTGQELTLYYFISQFAENWQKCSWNCEHAVLMGAGNYSWNDFLVEVNPWS